MWNANEAKLATLSLGNRVSTRLRIRGTEPNEQNNSVMSEPSSQNNKPFVRLIVNMKEYIEIQRDMYGKHNMLGDLPKDAEIRMEDIFQWIIENGNTYIGNNPEMAKTVVEKSHRKPELKACYNNSLLVRSSMPGLSYYEGWSSLILPMNHAWNMLDDEVVDVTMTLPEHEESEYHNNATREYFGVEIPWDWMFTQVREETHFRTAGSGGPFLYDYAIKRIMEEKQEE